MGERHRFFPENVFWINEGGNKDVRRDVRKDGRDGHSRER